MNEDPNKIRITDDDLRGVQIDEPWPGIPLPPKNPVGNSGPRQWGMISGAGSGASGLANNSISDANFLLKSWVYLGIAGVVGAFSAWALCEPGFEDGNRSRWGNILIFPLLVAAVSVALAVAESLVERSTQKAVKNGLLATALGVVLGFIFNIIANVIYSIGLTIITESAGQLSSGNPAVWFVRAIAWVAFGVSGGLVYGIVGRSWKKCLYGALGGMIGAGIGGLFFDPISLLTGGGGPSRCIGMMIFGASTGVAIGLVESALKNRWLYVCRSSGWKTIYFI